MAINADPTVGGSRASEERSQIVDNTDFPEAYVEPAPLQASDAQIVRDVDENVATSTTDSATIEESDLAKRLAELAHKAPLSEPPKATQEKQSPTQEGVVDDSSINLETVDLSYLQLGEDYGVPDLNVNETDPEFQQWASLMEKFLGHSFDEYKNRRVSLKKANQLASELERQKQERNIQKQQAHIKQIWGVDDTEYQKRMGQVVDVFQKLDPVTQRLVDRDPMGAVKLWKDIEMTNKISNPEVPSIEKSTTKASQTGAAQPEKFTGRQIAAMSEREKRKYWSQIVSASENGLIDWSS